MLPCVMYCGRVNSATGGGIGVLKNIYIGCTWILYNGWIYC